MVLDMGRPEQLWGFGGDARYLKLEKYLNFVGKYCATLIFSRLSYPPGGVPIRLFYAVAQFIFPTVHFVVLEVSVLTPRCNLLSDKP